jgi:NAD(P)-dependent dehydrogenase (short-subunit alcohol dehydrogenase family)
MNKTDRDDDSPKIVVLGANADIGCNIARLYRDSGFQVCGTYRNENDNVQTLRNEQGIMLIRCDIACRDDIEHFCEALDAEKFNWTNFFSSVGTTVPIGGFFETHFDEWEAGVELNFHHQLRVLHQIYKLRNRTKISSVNFMAGGGTNSAFDNYSSYGVAKVALIKMCEFLDSEADDLKVQILGPGFVKTRTHQQTISAGEKAGVNYERVKTFLKNGKGASFSDIFEALRWLDESPKSIVGGRNFALQHDQFSSSDLPKALESDPHMYKLRRHGNGWEA